MERLNETASTERSSTTIQDEDPDLTLHVRTLFNNALLQCYLLSLSQWTKIISASLVILLSLLIFVSIKRKYNYWKNLGIPYTQPIFLVGNTLQRLGLTMPFYEYLENAYYKHNGRDYCGFYEFTKPGLIVSNPALLRSILVRDFDHFTERRNFRLAKVNPIAALMLTNLSGDQWRSIRSVLTPTFTVHRSRGIYYLVQERSRHLQADMERHAGKGCCLQSKTLCEQYMISAIASCAFGIQIEANTSTAKKFPEMAASLLSLSWYKAVKVMLMIVVPGLIDLVGRLGFVFTSEEFEFFRDVVGYTIRTRKSTGAWRGDFLDLMEDTKKLSQDSITAQSILFLLAGYANTSNALALGMHLLAHHPQHQAAVRREVALAIIRSGGSESFSYDTMLSLPYLNAVLDETLRLYPGGPIIERVCTKDYTIMPQNVTIKEGQPVLVPVWSIHRDPTLWPEPEKFIPERFMVQSKRSIAPFTYLPFGVGPRSCIGLRFAEMSVKQGILSLLTKFIVGPCSHHTVDPPPIHPRVLTLRIANELPLSFTPVEDLHEVLRCEMKLYPPSKHEQTGVIRELNEILKIK